jgi:hypothetical protein
LPRSKRAPCALLLGELRERGASAVDDHHRQAIRRRGSDAIEREQAAGPRPVLDDHRRAKRPGEIRRQHARIGVIAAAGAVADHEPHGLAGEVGLFGFLRIRGRQ